jgi:hypothetical protein
MAEAGEAPAEPVLVDHAGSAGASPSLALPVIGISSDSMRLR